MSPATPPTTTLLHAWPPPPEACPFPTVGYHFMGRIFCVHQDHRTFTSRNFTILLSTGDPYSVVLPYESEERLSIYAEDETGCEDTHYWWGVPCRFVRVRIGLPVLEQPFPRPFTLRALLPLRDVEDALPFVRLGGNFLYDNHARVELESVPPRGRLVIP